MEFLRCKACGADAVIPLEMDVDAGKSWLEDADEAHFFACQVCGDNWLSVKRPAEEMGACELTFLHQPNMEPMLRRTALMTNTIVLNE